MLEDSEPTSGSKFDLAALVFAIVFPSIVTYIYFNLLAESKSSLQQVSYAVGKALQFGLPVVWVWLFYRSRLNLKTSPAADAPARPNSILPGIGFGILVATTMVALFYFAIAPSETGTRLTSMVVEKINSMGLDSIWKYVAVGCFYTVVHSFLEEYYWRWFVYDLGKRFYSSSISNIVSSLGFAAHHVILLGFFFGWKSPWTNVISIAIAIGGSVWAWLYERDGNLRSAWVSHAIVDAGIFTLGYFIWTAGAQ